MIVGFEPFELVKFIYKPYIILDLFRRNIKMRNETKKVLILMLAANFVAACAGIHNGKYAQNQTNGEVGSSDKRKTSSGLLVSGEEIKSMSTKYFAQLDFTFENTSSKWINIKSVKLDFGSQLANEGINIPVGAELLAWGEAARQRKAISDYNTNLALASLVAVGGLTAAKSNSPQLKTGGAVVAAGGLTALAVNDISNELNSLELAKLVPDNHLLSNNFVVPPGMHAKRWVTIYTEKPYEIPFVTQVTLIVTLQDGKVEKLILPFRSGGLTSSVWQNGHPDSPAGLNKIESIKRQAKDRGKTLTNEEARSEVLKELM